MKHIRSLLLVALLPVVMLLPACQEKLPAYEPPEIPLSAGIIVNPQLYHAEVVRLSPDFTVKVANTGDDLDSWVLPVPYEVSVDITVFLARDPTRSVLIESSRTFQNPIDDLKWGYFVLINFDLPLTDSEGQNWDWGYPGIETLDLILQGRIRIPQKNLEINTPRARTTLHFISP